jgi:hypothetical protein
VTDDEAKAIGLRAVAAGWQWWPGDHIGPSGDLEVISTTCAPGLLVLTRRTGRLWQMPPEMTDGVGPYASNGPQWPDFRHPGTVRNLRAQVPEVADVEAAVHALDAAKAARGTK